MSDPKVKRIPGVFPTIEIEYDEDGWARKVIVAGVMDELEIVAMGDATPNRWLDIKFNGEDMTLN